MALPEVVSREEWLEARRRLLAMEKEQTRQRDALNAERRKLPMVAVEKEYVFEGPDGKATLAELFGDSRQLIVQHVMYGPDWESACPSCTDFTDEISAGMLAHLRLRDTAYVMVSRAPLPKIESYRALRGWTLPWYSSYGSDFNYDFQVTLDQSLPQLNYNYRPAPGLLDGEQSCEMGGFSFFLRAGDQVFHTYSAYARGSDHLIQTYALLDMTALGRQESWEEPKGRAEVTRDAIPIFTS
jgi:predicted dithiol-disulfide oxidoreductase (DUF899 family)